MRLWFASDNDTLEEYLWVDRSDNDNGTSYDDWVWQQSRPGYDPFAGIGCHNGGPIYSGGPDLPVIVTLLNSQSELEICTMSTAEALAQLEQVNAISAWTKSKYTSIVNTFESIRFIVLLTFSKEPHILLQSITSSPPKFPSFCSCRGETPMPYMPTISAGQTTILSSRRIAVAPWETIQDFSARTSTSLRILSQVFALAIRSMEAILLYLSVGPVVSRSGVYPSMTISSGIWPTEYTD
jgi:hypothetical protein